MPMSRKGNGNKRWYAIRRVLRPPFPRRRVDMTDADFGYGHEVPNDSGSDHNAIAAVIRRMVAKMDTAKLVQVTAVTGGGVNQAGTVTVLPLVQQIDGNGYG